SPPTQATRRGCAPKRWARYTPCSSPLCRASFGKWSSSARIWNPGGCAGRRAAARRPRLGLVLRTPALQARQKHTQVVIILKDAPRAARDARHRVFGEPDADVRLVG